MKKLIKKHYKKIWKRKTLNYSCPEANLMKICNKVFKFEKYIEIIQDRPLTITMTKFRISDHERNIGKGRHKAMRREERHWQTCKTKAVKGEEHLLSECNLYGNYRNKLSNIISKYDPKFRFFSDKEKIRYLSASNENNIIIALVQFLHEALLERYIFTSFRQCGHLQFHY